jgi:hypothetical protein
MTPTSAHPSPAFLAQLERTLAAYRATVESCPPGRCRLVRYVGADTPYGLDIAPDAIEREIASGLAQGLVVDWLLERPVLWLCMQEPGCPMPPWEKVKAEEAPIDVDALLRDAGFDV